MSSARRVADRYQNQVTAAAKTIPAWVSAGEEVSKMAGEYTDMQGEFKTMETRVQKTIDRLVAMKKDAEYGLQLRIDLLKNLSRPGWIGMGSLEKDKKLLDRIAQEMKTAVR